MTDKVLEQFTDKSAEITIKEDGDDDVIIFVDYPDTGYQFCISADAERYRSFANRAELMMFIDESVEDQMLRGCVGP